MEWRADGQLIALADSEAWYRVGWPMPYHDLYTTRIYLEPSRVNTPVARLQEAIPVAGGDAESVEDLRTE